jgi:hypothetical protein
VKRTDYLLKQPDGTVRARLVGQEGEGVSLEPWMIEGINNRGWRLESWTTKDPGIATHGMADWRGVANSLATVLGAILEDGREPNDEADEQLLAQARSAIDDFEVAQMEESVAQPSGAGEDGEEESDGDQS